jgi:hypothetical protein
MMPEIFDQHRRSTAPPLHGSLNVPKSRPARLELSGQSSQKLRRLNRNASGAHSLSAKLTMIGNSITPTTRSSSLDFSRPRDLIMPEQMALRGLSLCLYHQMDAQPSARKLSTCAFVVLERKCETEASTLRTCSVDAVIVIDNSIFSSAATLLAHCEAARHIASSMIHGDRLAVVSTHSSTRRRSHGTLSSSTDVVLLPLTQPRDSLLKETLDSMKTTYPFQPNENYLQSAIATGRGLLKSATWNGPLVQSTTGQILVFTANPAAMLNTTQGDRTIQTHLVNAAAFSWRKSYVADHNGWTI